MSATQSLRSFAVVERFLDEIAGDARRPGYVLIGDEAFLYEQCRKGGTSCIRSRGSARLLPA